MQQHKYPTGLLIESDVLNPEVRDVVSSHAGPLRLIVADPPYGKIVSDWWDHDLTETEQGFCDWMIAWTKAWGELLVEGGAFYIWGGTGKRKFRPFFRFLTEIEHHGFTVHNVITWSKKRAYGLAKNYLYTREECAFLVKGEGIDPAVFHIPYLATKRPYKGYNPKYPAKSDFYRRTNVWHETEILRGKIHSCQKSDRVSEIPIETHTDVGDTVVELFGGSASTSAAAHRLGRRWIAVEKYPESIEVIKKRFQTICTTP